MSSKPEDGSLDVEKHQVFLHGAKPSGIDDSPKDLSLASNINQRETTPDVRPKSMRPIVWASVVASLLFSMFLFSLDAVIVANVQPRIINDFGNVDKLPWISAGYGLGAVSVNLCVAKLFTLFDNKKVFIAGGIIFEAGSAICGAAPNMTTLIIGRVVCGMGCNGIYVGVINLLSMLTNEAERPLYLSFVGLTFGLGTILGPFLGGAFADGATTWRWCFYLNLCFGALLGPIYLFLLPSHCPRPGMTTCTRLRQIDWAGAILFAGSCVCLVIGISFGGAVYLWNSSATEALFVVSGVLSILFCLQQYFAILTTKEDRLVPVEILKNWEMQIFFAQSAAAITILYVPMYFIPLYFQFVQNDTALHSAVHLLPLMFTHVFGVVLNGAMMGKFGYYVPWYSAGGIISVVGGTLLHSTVQVETSSAAIYGYSVLCGLGSGMFVQASFPVSQLKVERHLIQQTVAFVGWGQITGLSMALAISHSIFINEATKYISNAIPGTTRMAVQNTITGADSAFWETLDPANRRLVLEAIVKSISNVYIMVVVAGALAVLLSIFIRRERLFVQPDKQITE